MEEQKKPEVDKSLSDKYLEFLFSSLLNIVEQEKRMLGGCSDIREYAESFGVNIELIRHKNYQLLMIDIGMLLGNIEKLVDATEHKKIKNLFSLIKKYELKCGGFIKTKSNHSTKINTHILKEEFYKTFFVISKIRSYLVTSLWELLKPIITKGRGDTS